MNMIHNFHNLRLMDCTENNNVNYLGPMLDFIGNLDYTFSNKIISIIDLVCYIFI